MSANQSVNILEYPNFTSSIKIVSWLLYRNKIGF